MPSKWTGQPKIKKQKYSPTKRRIFDIKQQKVEKFASSSLVLKSETAGQSRGTAELPGNPFATIHGDLLI